MRLMGSCYLLRSVFGMTFVCNFLFQGVITDRDMARER